MFEKENFYDNDSLIKEALGLELLEKYIEKTEDCKIKIPKIFFVDKNILKLQKIDSVEPSFTQMKQFGISLALLHKHKFAICGLSYDNFIGVNPQKNIESKNWGEFFFHYRLLSQIKMIKDDFIKSDFLKRVLKLEKKLIAFLNDNCDYFSLLHGDLWRGNVLFSKEIYLIDPAVYFGDREVDIAMSEMFGGFDKDFYVSYNSLSPLSFYYEDKKIIYNLYHYLNHYNIFGSSYLDSCNSYIKHLEEL